MGACQVKCVIAPVCMRVNLPPKSLFFLQKGVGGGMIRDRVESWVMYYVPSKIEVCVCGGGAGKPLNISFINLVSDNHLLVFE